MNGPSHMVFSASMYMLTAPYVNEHMLHTAPATPSTLVAGAIIAAGAGLIADLDTAKSRASSALGPFTRALSRVVTMLSGGHRFGTHSLLAILAVWLGVWRLVGVWGHSLPVMLCLTTFLISFAVRELLDQDKLPALFVLGISVVGGLACLAISPTYLWLQWAIVIGYTLHLVADSLTTEGVRLLWPLTTRTFGLKGFDSESLPARAITWGGGAVLVMLVLVQIVLPQLAINHPDLLNQSSALRQLVSYR
jgi:membrane-bound metal-dependent hydrolase YbcI (DUF457 family)